ncbi:MAG: DUF1501 domain-containing protein, partial [Planctomycetota bacterium]
SADRLTDRRQLLASVDTMRRELDHSGRFEGLDAFTQQALGVLTSSALAEALAVCREDRAVRARYVQGVP